MTNEEVKLRLQNLRCTYRDGLYWNHNPEFPNDPGSITTTPCRHHDNGCDIYAGKCGCNFFGCGIQCHGFALYMANLVFNSYPMIGTKPAPANGEEINNGWKLYTREYIANFDSDESFCLEPGDIVRCGNHTAIVYDVDKTTDRITVGDLWSSHGCKIHWGDFYANLRNYQYQSLLMVNCDYLVKAPKTQEVQAPLHPDNDDVVNGIVTNTIRPTIMSNKKPLYKPNTSSNSQLRNWLQSNLFGRFNKK